jgi:AcrR family transcriptional regulator
METFFNKNVSIVSFSYTFGPRMEQKEQQFLEQVDKLFLSCGIKSLTMDDIARELGISKKTLYQYCTDKEDLLIKSFSHYFKCEESFQQAIWAKNLNAVDEIFEVSKHVAEMLKNLHPSVHYDLRKYYPEAWKIFSEYRKNFLLKCVSDNMEKGKKEGLYRANLNIPIVARIHIARIDVIFDGELFPASQFNFAEVFFELIRYHIRGIASPQGIEYFMDKIKTIDPTNPKI